MPALLKGCKGLQSSQQGVLNQILGRSLQSSSYLLNQGSENQVQFLESKYLEKEFSTVSKGNFDLLKQNKYSNGQISEALAKAQYSTQIQKSVVNKDNKLDLVQNKTTDAQQLQTVNKILSNPYVKTMIKMSPLALMGSVSFADVPEKWQMGMQDPATPFCQNAIDIHLETLTLIYFLTGLNYYLLGRFVLRYMRPPYDNTRPGRETEHPIAETVWTLLPVAAVAFLAVSAFGLIYSEEVLANRDSFTGLTVKIIGRQWYWTYNYPSFMEDFDGDSYKVPDDELEDGQFRMLEVDNRMVLPTNTPIRLIITASDVLHSWAVPSFGVKCDAVPGRLNMVNTFIKRPGVFYGQCSELCGIQHFGMPICVVAIPPDDDLWH